MNQITVPLDKLFDVVAHGLYAHMTFKAQETIDRTSRELYDHLPKETRKAIFKEFQKTKISNFQTYLSIRYLSKQINCNFVPAENEAAQG